ncbi:uncharacterized protein LOC141664675 [Apium graveolens]|uniref:uncharacterized protein LOC141664675 n=1 Tax=Apium graveolens TaxID=4045 RepID=UPI003D7946AE
MVTESTMVMDFIDTSAEPQGRGSRPGKSSNHNKQRLSRGKNLMEDYFVDRPIFSKDDFRQWYRMCPNIFNRIMTALCTQDSYWHQKPDATGLLRIGESTTLECMKKFCQQVEGLFGEEYLRAPTPADLRRLLVRGEQRGFSAHCTQDSYWHQKPDVTRLLGLLPQQKMIAALRMLAYGATADQCAEICRMGESTTF